MITCSLCLSARPLSGAVNEFTRCLGQSLVPVNGSINVFLIIPVANKVGIVTPILRQGK